MDKPSTLVTSAEAKRKMKQTTKYSIVVLLIAVLVGCWICMQDSSTKVSGRNVASRTFTLKEGLEKVPMHESDYVDFGSYLYRLSSIRQHQGRVLVVTDPAERGGHVISPGLPNGFVGAVYRAYNQHRHLILSPDDVWLAVTTAFGVFMGMEENAEMMREKFVDFEGKMKLVVEDGGSIDNADWNHIIDSMSNLIQNKTKGDTRSWIEPDFSTTTPVGKTVGQVALMAAMKHYFEYEVILLCGLPKVTLEGTLEDWKHLQEKARHFGSFGIEPLSHWSELLDFVIQKMIDSYEGNVDMDFWGHIIADTSWDSGSHYIGGWANVFMPFLQDGTYRLSDVKAQSHKWGTIEEGDIPSSIVEVPVTINDNGEVHETLFYGGHIVALYNPDDDSIRTSLDWTIVDITGSIEVKPEYDMMFLDDDDEDYEDIPERIRNYRPKEFPRPVKFSYNV